MCIRILNNLNIENSSWPLVVDPDISFLPTWCGTTLTLRPWIRSGGSEAMTLQNEKSWWINANNFPETWDEKKNCWAPNVVNPTIYHLQLSILGGHDRVILHHPQKRRRPNLLINYHPTAYHRSGLLQTPKVKADKIRSKMTNLPPLWLSFTCKLEQPCLDRTTNKTRQNTSFNETPGGLSDSVGPCIAREIDVRRRQNHSVRAR